MFSQCKPSLLDNAISVAVLSGEYWTGVTVMVRSRLDWCYCNGSKIGLKHRLHYDVAEVF